MPGPSEPKPTETPAKRLTPGETVIVGDDIPITVDGFLCAVFSIAGVDYCQIKFRTEGVAPGSFKMVPLPRELVRVPAMIRGTKY